MYEKNKHPLLGLSNEDVEAVLHVYFRSGKDHWYLAELLLNFGAEVEWPRDFWRKPRYKLVEWGTRRAQPRLDLTLPEREFENRALLIWEKAYIIHSEACQCRMTRQDWDLDSDYVYTLSPCQAFALTKRYVERKRILYKEKHK